MSDDYTCIDVDKKHNSKYCFAVTGNSWANVVEYFPELVPIIVSKGLVFARMSGIQKQQLIEEFKNLGYYVGKFLKSSENTLVLVSTGYVKINEEIYMQNIIYY